jgi:hypothetical protein
VVPAVGYGGGKVIPRYMPATGDDGPENRSRRATVASQSVLKDVDCRGQVPVVIFGPWPVGVAD